MAKVRMARVRAGAIIKLMDYEPPKVAQVMDELNIQFTVQYLDGTNTTSFRFYADEGDTWIRTEGDGS